MSLIDNVLTFVNNERVELGLPTLHELPTGIPGDDHECVIGRCFNGQAASGRVRAAAGSMVTYAMTDEGEHEITHPGYVREFVLAFDRGEYPHLIDEAA